MTSLQQYDPLPLEVGPKGVGLGSMVPSRDRYRGALIGAAIGDALGRPAEARTPDQIRTRYGSITDYVPWRGWRGGPKGDGHRRHPDDDVRGRVDHRAR